MASVSRKRGSTTASINKAINFARPVRARQPRSLPKSSEIASHIDSGRETVADALSHLFPVEVPSSTTTQEPTIDQDNEESAEPHRSPLTPVFSPLSPVVEEDATAVAERSPINGQHTQQLPPTRNKRKRTASPSIPDTPPQRQVRKKTGAVTTGEKAPAHAPRLLSRLVRSIASASLDDTTDLLLVEDSAHGFVDEELDNSASQKQNTKEILDKALTIAHDLLRRQRVLIHDYDAFDVKTYSPRGHIDEGTLAFRELTGVLRTGLYDLEERIGELADL
jgi:hypothetical protein